MLNISHSNHQETMRDLFNEFEELQKEFGEWEVKTYFGSLESYQEIRKATTLQEIRKELNYSEDWQKDC